MFKLIQYIKLHSSSRYTHSQLLMDIPFPQKWQEFKCVGRKETASVKQLPVGCPPFKCPLVLWRTQGSLCLGCPTLAGQGRQKEYPQWLHPAQWRILEILRACSLFCKLWLVLLKVLLNSGFWHFPCGSYIGSADAIKRLLQTKTIKMSKCLNFRHLSWKVCVPNKKAFKSSRRTPSSCKQFSN